MLVGLIRKICNKFFLILFSGGGFPKTKSGSLSLNDNVLVNSKLANFVKITFPYDIRNVSVGSYSYIAKNPTIANTDIGKFCSIGPNFCCGLGVHPIKGISTSPIFYSIAKQTGTTFVQENIFEETIPIKIGNDVFIGANVTVLDGVIIGDGAVIGAGAVVTKNIPPYAVVGGVPAKFIKYRFNTNQIKLLLEKKWWDSSDANLQLVKDNFFDVEEFLNSKYVN